MNAAESSIKWLLPSVRLISVTNAFTLKKHIPNVVEATGRLSKQISQFIRGHYEEFLPFDNLKIYYDNGQVKVSKILYSVFNTLLPNPIFQKVMPSEYKLFLTTDLLCTLKLVRLKLENNMLSKSKKLSLENP